MWRNLFIALHTATAVTALLAGAATLRRVALFDVYLWSLVGMEVFLVPALVVDWGDLDAVVRVLFVALAVLGAVMVGLAVQARSLRPVGGRAPSARYVDRVMFTLVALFDAFAVITVLDAGAPGWLVAVTAVVIAAAGHVVLRRVRARLVNPGSG